MIDVTECPLCEQEASGEANIKMGSSWKETFGRPPHSLFDKYKMVHVADTPQGRKAFLHTEADLMRGHP